jgi:DNA-binding CsgD family transcriptional regulator
MAEGSSVSSPPSATTGLLEREREVAVLRAQLAATTAGAAGVVLIEGPAGIGKSRLLAELRRDAAEAGVRVLAARGGEIERDFPFGVVRQLFEPLVADPAIADRVLVGAAASAAPVFASPGESGGEASDSSFASLHGLYWLAANLSGEGPLVLGVDDLHWCDRASLRFLVFLARRLEGLPVLLAGSLRPSEPGADLALLAELGSDPLSVAIRPDALSWEAVGELAATRLGAEVARAFSVACHEATGGNPLLVSELLKALEAENVAPEAANVRVVAEIGPRAASRAVLLRLARLPEATVAVARALAVLGDGAEIGTVGPLAGVDEQSAAEATATLARVEIIRPGSPLGFVHPLVHAAVYHDLAPAERALQHERAAALLTAIGAPSEQVAAHLVHAPARGDAGVVETLRAAARAALRRGAADSAVSSLSRALREPPDPELRPRVLVELGQAETLTYAPAGGAHLKEAVESLSDPVERGRAADGLVRTMLFTGDPDEAVGVARHAQADLSSEEDDLRQRLEALELLAFFFGARDDHGLHERLRRYRHGVAGDGVGARMLMAIAAWGWTLDGGSAKEVSELALEALADGRLLATDSGLFSVIASIPLAMADRPESAAVLEAIRIEGHTSGSVFATTGYLLWGGHADLLRGELADGEASLRLSVETIALWGVPESSYACGFVSEALIERGALHEARATLGKSEIPPSTSDRMLLLDRAHCALLLAEGRAEEALARVEALRARAGWRYHPIFLPWRSLEALALDRLGRTEEAIARAREDVDHARAWGAGSAVGRALRILGTLERDRGLPQLEEAVEVLEGSPARLELAKALAALGGRIRRDRRPSEAREPLRRALELAEVCGATVLGDAVRSEIYATGMRPRTAALQGVDSLTASERRVAALAAGGQSNRDIAQVLYVTPKTVEVHLSSVYRKLGISSRRELDPALAAG